MLVDYYNTYVHHCNNHWIWQPGPCSHPALRTAQTPNRLALSTTGEVGESQWNDHRPNDTRDA